MASIPPMQSLEGRASCTIEIRNYDDWPYKIIYASNGLKGETILKHLVKFYTKNPKIPLNRRPNQIHVAGKYAIFRSVEGMKLISPTDGSEIIPEIGPFRLTKRDSDLQAIVFALSGLQQNASASTEILYEYIGLVNNVFVSVTPIPHALER